MTDTRTRIDFAHCLYDLSEKYYPHAEKIVLVMDNLNTHSLASLYEAFEPATARRLAERFEIHYTPKHASWLDMAEIEIGVMSRQCLNRRIATKVDWQFTTSDARPNSNLFIRNLKVVRLLGRVLKIILVSQIVYERMFPGTKIVFF